jgi:anti-sigma B factor antagonist
MIIEKKLNGDELVIALTGRLDTVTSPELETALKGDLDNVKKLVFDLEKLEYLSSAGLRVLLATQKLMNKQGEMVVRNSSDATKEIFDITGFSDILTLE